MQLKSVPKTKLVLILLALAGGFYFLMPREPAQAEIEYTTATVDLGNIQRLVVTSGSVKAVGTVEVGSQISGQISELFVDFNSPVNKGDLLARLDPRTYEGRLKQADAQVEIAKASIIQQQANLERVQADLGEAERLFERQKQLAGAGHISATELDSLATALQSAKAQVKIAEAQLGNAKASLKQAEASQFQASIDLERCTIRSPVDGVVINRSIELGQTVAASMSAPVLFTIAQDLREMQVEASVDEADIGKVKNGQVAMFTVEAFPERRFRGVIKQVRNAATEVQNVVTYTVIISADNRDKRLLPGMTATLEIVTGEQQNVVRINNTALRFRPKGADTKVADPRMAFMENRIRTMTADLGLNEQQVDAVRKIFAERMNNVNRRPGGMTPGEGPGRRPNMFDNDELRKILSESQYQTFLESMNDFRLGGNRDRERPRPGEVWVLTDNQQLERRSVLVGLSGDEFSELVSGDIKPGERVVVRARAVQR